MMNQEEKPSGKPESWSERWVRRIREFNAVCKELDGLGERKLLLWIRSRTWRWTLAIGGIGLANFAAQYLGR